MKSLILALALGLNSPLDGGEVKKVQFNFGNLVNKRMSYIPEYDNHEFMFYKELNNNKLDGWAYESILEVDILLAKSRFGELYINNDIIGYVTTRHYRYVSWDFEIGQQINKTVTLYYHHKSEHVLEMHRDIKYPLHDSIGIKLCFYGTVCND